MTDEQAKALDAEMMHGCLLMIREDLAHFMGEDLKRTPDMMLNDALRELMRRKQVVISDAESRLLAAQREVSTLEDEVRELKAQLEFANRPGIAQIARERQRQRDVKGFDDAHDDEHTMGELARAAAVYAMPEPARGLTHIHFDFPWGLDWWKPTPDDRVRELVKAGALIVAEIERLQRKERANVQSA